MGASEAEVQYLDKALDIYSKVGEIRTGIMSFRPIDDTEFVDFQLALFMHQADFLLSSKLEARVASIIKEIRRTTEIERIKIENQFEEKELKPLDFVKAVDDEIASFQNEMANALEPQLYEDFFGLKPGETVTLSDPDIVKQVYGAE